MTGVLTGHDARAEAPLRLRPGSLRESMEVGECTAILVALMHNKVCVGDVGLNPVGKVKSMRA